MSILEELKKLTHPYEDEDDDPAGFEDELEERDMLRTAGPARTTGGTRWSTSTPPPN